MVFHEDSMQLGDQFIPWSEVIKSISNQKRTSTSKVSMPRTDVELSIGLHYVSSYISQVVGVEVNTLTGEIQVLETEMIPAAGKVINPLGYEGQAEGGFLMCIGYALTENLILDNEGKLLTKNFQTYLLPTIEEMPNIKVTPVEIADDDAPYGAKGLGELTSIPGTPAITNAIFDAIGVRFCALPITPEMVLAAL